jgi:hypothetical protein
MLANMQGNYMPYDKQLWIVPSEQTKIIKVLEDNLAAIPNIGILPLRTITEFVKEVAGARNGKQD